MEATTRCATRKLVWTALLSSLAAVLMYLDMAIPIFPTFLKMDMSDLPALIASFTWGPVSGVFVELVKNLLHAFTTSTAGIGEGANFLIGSALVVPAGMIYRQFRTKKGALAGLIAGTVVMTFTAALANYFLLLPFYSKLVPLEKIIDLSARLLPAVHDKLTLVLYAIVPFNLLKGTLVSLLTLWLYKRISSLLCS